MTALRLALVSPEAGVEGSARMHKVISIVVTLLTITMYCGGTVEAQPAGDAKPATSQSAAGEPFLTGPPQQAGPVVVRARLQLRDTNDINDETETFEFGGVLVLTWHDERQAFDPAEVGVDEKVYLGAYQFNEVFTGWFPPVVLVNESGLYEKHGVVLRVQPDGTLTLVETLDAVAEADLSLKRYPFDRHRRRLPDRGERDLAPYLLSDLHERVLEPELFHHVRDSCDQPGGWRVRPAGKGGGRRSRRSPLSMDLSSHLFWAHGAHVRSGVRILLALMHRKRAFQAS